MLIGLEHRKCIIRKTGSIGVGDELHKCNYFHESRDNLLDTYFIRRPNTIEMDKRFKIKIEFKSISEKIFLDKNRKPHEI